MFGVYGMKYETHVILPEAEKVVDKEKVSVHICWLAHQPHILFASPSLSPTATTDNYR